MDRDVRTDGASESAKLTLGLDRPVPALGPKLSLLLPRLELRPWVRTTPSSIAFILSPVSSFIFLRQSRSDQPALPSWRIRLETSRISKYPYLLCLGMANMRERGSKTLATRRLGRPYRQKVSQVGNRNRSSISKPLTAGWTSGMMKTKPSVEDGGSEWMVMLPSILIRVEASMSDLAWG